jgi:hypothetical protein
MEIASQVNYFDFEVDVELKEVEGSIDHGFQSSGSGPESSNNSPEPGANKDDGKPPTTPAALYKTQICRYFTSGFCANGQKVNLLHFSNC